MSWIAIFFKDKKELFLQGLCANNLPNVDPQMSQSKDLLPLVRCILISIEEYTSMNSTRTSKQMGAFTDLRILPLVSMSHCCRKPRLDE